MTFTPRDQRAAAFTLLIACACALWFSWMGLGHARVAASNAADAHAGTLTKIRLYERLRSEEELVEARPKPEPELVARLQASLHDAGISPTALTQVSLQKPVPAGDAASPYRRQAVRLTIDGVRTPELARFLVHWSESEPLWAVRSIRLQHQQQRGRSRQAADDRFTISITLVSVHLAGATPTAPRTATDTTS